MKLSPKALMELVEGDLSIAKMNDLATVMPEILKNAKLIRPLIKRLVVAWSQFDEQTSLHAYRCLLTIVRNGDHVRNVVQNMYSAFVKNCKFVNPENIHHIRLMEGTLTSVLQQDLNESFHFAYMHVQNMAAHLRKAISQPRGDNLASVYNWQYIRSLSLWCRFLTQHTQHKQLSTLIYPLVQNIEGTLRLCPSARWIPLRFHCLEMLNMLSAAANLLIPVIPFIIDVFDIVDFNKRQIIVDFEVNKPLNLAVMLRFSNSQMRDRTFRDAVMDALYELLVENINAHGKSICFPEYVRALSLELREFCRNCKIANYCKPIRVLLQKINENGLYVEHNRRSVSDLNDKKAVELLEAVMRPPFSAFYHTYRERRDEELRQLSSGKTEENDDDEDAFMMDDEESEPENCSREKAVECSDDSLDEEMMDEFEADENALVDDQYPSEPPCNKDKDSSEEQRSRKRSVSASVDGDETEPKRRHKKTKLQAMGYVVSDESSEVDAESFLPHRSLSDVTARQWRAKGNVMEASEEEEVVHKPLNKNLKKYFESRSFTKSEGRAKKKGSQK